MNVLLLGTDTSAFTEGSALFKRLSAYGTRVDALCVVVISRSLFPSVKIGENVWVHSASGTPFTRFFVAVALGKKIAKEKKVDVVSAQDPFEIGWVGAQIAKKSGAKLHLQVHTDIGSPFFKTQSWKNRVRLILAKRLLPQADSVRAVSRRSAEGVKQFLGDRQISILPIRAVPPISPNTENKKPFGFTLLMLGRLAPEKDIQTAIRTVALLKKTYPTIGLLIVGDGSERVRLEALVQAEGVTKNVLFQGSTPAYEAFAQAHALLHTSRYEGYGLVFVESALAGVPIVSTDVGIMGDVFKDGESALLCPVGDVSCLKNKISQLIEDVRLQFTLRENAKLAAEKHLMSEEEYLERWIDAFKKSKI